MEYRRAPVVALILGVVLVASLLLVMPSLSLVATKSSESPKRILALDPQELFYRGEDEEVIIKTRNMTVDELASIARGIGVVKSVHPAG